MEPEKTPLEKENHLNQTIIFRFKLSIFGAVPSMVHGYCTFFTLNGKVGRLIDSKLPNDSLLGVSLNQKAEFGNVDPSNSVIDMLKTESIYRSIVSIGKQGSVTKEFSL